MKTIAAEAKMDGGRLVPLLLPAEESEGLGLCNPSVLIENNRILINLRKVNYALWHSERDRQFFSRWGPLTYLHPEDDQHLRTTNYLLDLDRHTFQMNAWSKIDTSHKDVDPLWEFVGLEDGRLVKWDGVIHLLGVRRDVDTIGTGRMEYSTLHVPLDLNDGVSEIVRARIPAPGADDSYCEKNWMPVLTKPHTFIKWTSPTEVVETEVFAGGSTVTKHLRPGLDIPFDLRGGSQVVPWGNFYIAIVHHVDLTKNYLDQKDAVYRHRFAVWDREFNLLGISTEPLSFLGGDIEFCAGAGKLDGNLLVTFGFQDNAAFLLEIPGRTVDIYIEDALSYVA